MAIAFLCDCSLSLGRYSFCPFLPRYCSFSLVVWGEASTRSAPRPFLALTRFAWLHPCLFFTSLLWIPLATATSLGFGRGYSVYWLPWLVLLAVLHDCSPCQLSVVSNWPLFEVLPRLVLMPWLFCSCLVAVFEMPVKPDKTKPRTSGEEGISCCAARVYVVAPPRRYKEDHQSGFPSDRP